MSKKPDPFKVDADNPEWTDEMFDEAKPAKELLPKEFFEGVKELKLKRGERGAQKSPTKKPISLRLDADVSAWLRSQKGYNALANEALRREMQNTLKD